MICRRQRPSKDYLNLAPIIAELIRSPHTHLRTVGSKHRALARRRSKEHIGKQAEPYACENLVVKCDCLCILPSLTPRLRELNLYFNSYSYGPANGIVE